jgi:hypothetical protein
MQKLHSCERKPCQLNGMSRGGLSGHTESEDSFRRGSAVKHYSSVPDKKEWNIIQGRTCQAINFAGPEQCSLALVLMEKASF